MGQAFQKNSSSGCFSVQYVLPGVEFAIWRIKNVKENTIIACFRLLIATKIFCEHQAVGVFSF